MVKQNLTQEKHTFTNQNKCTTNKPSYDIWPGNREGLFWFQQTWKEKTVPHIPKVLLWNNGMKKSKGNWQVIRM